MSKEREVELPLIFVPIWPILTPLLAGWCAMMDVSIIVAHAVTKGGYPSLVKVVVCTAVTISINAYCFWTARKHRECRAEFVAVVKEGIGRPAITARQAGIVVAAAMFFSVLWAWAFFFTSD